MRQLLIMYPDGRYHTVNANRFYSVIYQGKETYVVDYDDLTANARNCFTILEKEGNTFVKKPLKNQEEYAAFLSETLYASKRTYDLNVLPGKIGLCKEALALLKPVAPPVQNGRKPVQSSKKRQIIIYRDISQNHDDFPYYIDRANARLLGFMCNGPYYHISSTLLESLRRVFDVVEQDVELNLVAVNSTGKKPTVQVAAGSPPVPPVPPSGESKNGNNNPPLVTATASSEPPKSPSRKPEVVVVYEDISPIREEFPFYLTQYDAKRFGLKVAEEKQYYHLKKAEFDVISRYAIINLEKKELAILPQKNRRNVGRSNPVKPVEPAKTVQLNPKELETLDNLFDSLMDFEDYYSFFGIEELREAAPEQVLSSPRIIALTNLFNKGKECGNDIAINLVEFLDGFIKDLKQKGKKF